MQKTVKVVDEVGNRYEATYVKRANGLVKNGRARFIDNDTICLARPPYNMEDIKMTDINKNEAIVDTKEEKAMTPEALIAAAPSKYTLDYALEQIEKIQKDTEYLIAVIGGLKSVESVKSGGAPDFGAEEKAKALGEVVKCRETTNQQLIKFYEKMIDDLKPKSSVDENRDFLNWVQGCISVTEPGNDRPLTEYAEFFKAIKSMDN